MFFVRFIKFLQYFGKGYEFKLVNMLFMAFMTSLLEFLSIVLVFPLILILVNPFRVVNNPIAIYIQQHFHISGIRPMILFIGGLIVSVIIIKNIYSILIIYWQNKTINKWGLEIKEKFLSLYLYSPFEADVQRGNNRIIDQITDDINEVIQYFVFKVISFISNTLVILCIFLILMYLLPLYTLLAVLFFSVAGSVQGEFFRKWSTNIGIKKHNLTSGPYLSVINSLSCIKDIKINGCQKYFYNYFHDISEKIIPYDEKISLIPLIPQYILEIIFVFTMVILCIGILTMYGENPSNILISFGIVAVAIYRVVPQIYKNQVYLNYINLTKEKVEKLFEQYNNFYSYRYPEKQDTKERISFSKEITINGLNYSYNKKEDVLTDINLTINKGEFIGIIGFSGAGKSTFVDCLLGLLDYQGDIYVDDIKLDIDNIQTFRNIIGYVPQKTCTTEGDIYSNVAWGVERKDIDKDKVDEVLKIAQLYDQLKQTENGLDIEIKRDGSGLSGGQLQRIGIARALYRNPDIIILDEATANLDVKIENKLTDVLNELKGQKTIIAIAHRLSTLVNCDRVVYMKDGKIIDVGTFQELSEKHKDFEEIVKLSRIKLDNEEN